MFENLCQIHQMYESEFYNSIDRLCRNMRGQSSSGWEGFSMVDQRDQVKLSMENTLVVPLLYLL